MVGKSLLLINTTILIYHSYKLTYIRIVGERFFNRTYLNYATILYPPSILTLTQLYFLYFKESLNAEGL